MKGIPPKGAAPGGRPKMDKDLIIEMDKTIDHLTKMAEDQMVKVALINKINREKTR